MDLSYAIADLLNTKGVIRRRALLAVEENGSREATEHIVRVLERDDESFLRAEAARILGQLADERAVEPLLAALCRDTEEVAYWTADSLARLGAHAADAVFTRARQCEEDSEDRAFFWLVQVLCKIGPTCVPRLIGLLDTQRWTRRRTVAEAMQRLGPVAEDAVLGALEHPNPDVRYWLCRILGGIGGNDAVEALRRHVADDEQAVRAAAVSALGKIGSHRAIEYLKEILGEGPGDVRVQSVEVLGVLGKDACDVLAECLDDEAWMVRDRAAACLARIGREALPVLTKARLTGNENVRVHAVKALGQMGNDAVPQLTAALEDSSPAVRKKAADCLARCSWEILDSVRKILANGEIDARVAALRALSGTGNEQAQPLLLTALQGDMPELRRLAIENIGRDGEAEFIPVLMKHMGDADDLVRETAMERLEKHPAREPLFQALTTALRDESWVMRRGAATVLGRIGSEAVVPLSAVLREENEDARYWAIQALGGIGRQAVRPLIRFLDDSSWNVRRNAAEALIECGEDVVADLFRSLEDESGVSEDRIYWSSYILEHMGAQVLPGVCDAMRSGVEAVRRVATGLLGIHADRDDVLPILTDALHDESTAVRLMAIKAVGRSGRRELISELMNLRQVELETRLVVAENIGRLGGAEAREALRDFLADESWLVRRAVLTGICHQPRALSLQSITPLLHDPVSVIVNLAVRILGLRGEKSAVESLVPLLDDINHRRDVLDALGRIGGTQAEASLIRFARDADQRIRECVAAGLAQSDSRAAQDVLTELLDDPFWNVRRAAAEALNRREESAPEAEILESDEKKPLSGGLEGTAEDWYREGQRRRRAGDAEGSVAAFRAALLRDPEHVPSLSKLGLACEERGEVGEAISLLEKARDLKPDLAPVRVYLGIAYTLQKRVDLALPELERAVELAPGSESARIARTILAKLQRNG